MYSLTILLYYILMEKNDVRYWTYGAKQKPTLVFIHGFTGSHEGFQYILPQLEKDFYCIVPDLPGFGESKLGFETWTIDELAKRVNTFVAALGLRQPPYLLSHSMGGLVAASMLAQAPELFAKKTVFISPVAEKVNYFDSRKLGVLLGSLQYYLGAKVPHFGPKLVGSKLLSKIATSFIMTAKHPEMRGKIYQHHYDNLDYISSIDYYLQLHRDINKKGTIDYADALKQFNVLIVAGDKDNVTPLAGEKKLAKKVGAQLEIIPGVGHLAHYETPEAISRAVQHFLQ